MKGCYKTKDINILKGTILCMAAMLSFGTVACGSNSSKSASSSERVQKFSHSSTEAGKSTESTSGSSIDNSTTSKKSETSSKDKTGSSSSSGTTSGTTSRK